jgi:hypothetical protein
MHLLQYMEEMVTLSRCIKFALGLNLINWERKQRPLLPGYIAGKVTGCQEDRKLHAAQIQGKC